jgi:hypothetical protein
LNVPLAVRYLPGMTRIPTLVLLLGLPGAGLAQPLQTLTVGPTDERVVLPRSAPAPRLVPAPPAGQPLPLAPLGAAAPAAAAPVAAGTGLAIGPSLLVPLAATAILGGALPGLGGGGSAPASTR